MPRKHVPITANFPYHITARTVNREPFKINIDEAWEIYTEQLNFCNFAFSVDIMAFLMMTNHFHLICRCKIPNLDKFMHHFMKETSRHINGEASRINQLYGGSYHKSLITSDLYYKVAYKYLYRNPVAGKLVAAAEDYKYTTLRSVIGLDSIKVPIHDELILESPSIDNHLEWINEPYSEKHARDIKNGLQRSTFGLAKDKKSRAHRLERLRTTETLKNNLPEGQSFLFS